MNSPAKFLLYSATLAILISLEVDTTGPFPVKVVKEAIAIVGAPLTPISVAGVARRTAVRSSAAASSAAATSAAASKPPAPAAPGGPALPVGTVVSGLPAGCSSVQMNETSYFNCQGTYFRPAYQGQNVVYIVEKP
jgi:hypothetical protein